QDVSLGETQASADGIDRLVIRARETRGDSVVDDVNARGIGAVEPNQIPLGRLGNGNDRRGGAQTPTRRPIEHPSFFRWMVFRRDQVANIMDRYHRARMNDWHDVRGYEQHVWSVSHHVRREASLRP